MNEEVKACVQRESKFYFNINRDTQNKALLWDKFKAYMSIYESESIF